MAKKKSSSLSKLALATGVLALGSATFLLAYKNHQFLPVQANVVPGVQGELLLT